jgi:hypothetical protein
VSSALLAEFPAITPPTSPAAEAPLFALGFAASNYLITNSYRAAYLADAAANPDSAVPNQILASGLLPASSPLNTLRQAFKKNDLRGWSPASPVLLCGGHGDPTVYYSVNTGTIASIFQLAGNPYVSTIDVDSSSGYTAYGPALSAQLAGLQTALQAQFISNEGAYATANGQTAAIQNYHGTLVPPFCTKAAQQFFSGL